tara:strand:+ start:523 stop:1902 length:1380 start_codon:yes stop_codon:yes gene_type:complete
MAFNAEIGNYAGETDAYPNAISKFLANGVQWVISIIEKTNPDMLPLFASLQTLNDSTRTLTLNTNSKIIDIVRRNGNATNGEELKCSPINAAFRSNAKNTDSIYYASKNSPVYYIDNAVLNVLPIPDNDQIVKISIVLPDTSVAGTDSAIDNFPSEMYHAVVLYAAAQLLHHKMAALNAKLPTDLDADTTAFNAIDDIGQSLSVSTSLPSWSTSKSLPGAMSISASVGDWTDLSSAMPSFNISSSLSSEYTDSVNKAKHLLDDTGSIGGDSNNDVTSVQGWLADEDEEMTQATLGAAAQELQRASTHLSKFQNDVNNEVQDFQNDMATFQAKITEEQAEINAEVQKVQTEIAQDSTIAQTDIAIYQAELQKEQTRFNAEITKYQAELQSDMEGLNYELQEWNANLQKKISLYTTLISKLNTDYQWLQSQYQVVKSELSEFMTPYTQAGILDSTAEGVRR